MKLPIIALAALLSASAAFAAPAAVDLEDAGASAARFGAVARVLASSKAKADPSVMLAQTPAPVEEAPLGPTPADAKPADAKPANAEQAADRPDDAKPGARAADAKADAKAAGAAAVAKAPEPKSRPIVVRWWPHGRPVPSYGQMDDFAGIEPRLEAARRTLDDSERFPPRRR
ncbi:MAG: hypothetical protein ACFCUS_05615 [Rubrimonas sp.]|uniref:hypothetical protein n=1 Tax=Rubrimonas sp. TaxID=2036015 RepID=UPI002FDDF5DD